MSVVLFTYFYVLGIYEDRMFVVMLDSEGNFVTDRIGNTKGAPPANLIGLPTGSIVRVPIGTTTFTTMKSGRMRVTFGVEPEVTFTPTQIIV